MHCANGNMPAYSFEVLVENFGSQPGFRDSGAGASELTTRPQKYADLHEAIPSPDGVDFDVLVQAHFGKGYRY